MKCTYCDGTRFYEGPSGGMCTNILCVNPNCRHWFNYTAVLDTLEDLNRVEPSDEEKESSRLQQEKEREEYPHHCYNQGEAACRQGTSLKDLFESHPTGSACTAER